MEEDKARLPDSAFQGRTPNEMFFGRGEWVPDRLAAERAAARQARLDFNRSLRYGICA